MIISVALTRSLLSDYYGPILLIADEPGGGSVAVLCTYITARLDLGHERVEVIHFLCIKVEYLCGYHAYMKCC